MSFFLKSEIEAIKLFSTLFLTVRLSCDNKCSRNKNIKLAKLTKTTSTIISRQIEKKTFKSLDILHQKKEC